MISWRERLRLRSLSLIEGVVMAVLPRGAMRQRLLKWVDRGLSRSHEGGSRVDIER